jgi:hypothetical protein
MVMPRSSMSNIAAHGFGGEGFEGEGFRVAEGGLDEVGGGDDVDGRRIFSW